MNGRANSSGGVCGDTGFLLSVVVVVLVLVLVLVLVILVVLLASCKRAAGPATSDCPAAWLNTATYSHQVDESATEPLHNLKA